MLTEYKKKDVKKLLQDDYPFHPIIGLVADKARVVYQALAWKHWELKGGDPEELITDLVKHCLESINVGKDESQCSSGGITVQIHVDEEDYLNLEIYFNLS